VEILGDDWEKALTLKSTTQMQKKQERISTSVSAAGDPQQAAAALTYRVW
jgi:hypothetical protein